MYLPLCLFTCFFFFFCLVVTKFTHDTNFCLKKLIECSLIRDANFTEIKLTGNTEEDFFLIFHFKSRLKYLTRGRGKFHKALAQVIN